MFECGSMKDPPSIENVTVWGIITFIIMAVLGIASIYGVINAIQFWSLWSILDLVASGFGVAGLIFVILSIYQKNANYMRLGILCFFINCVCCVVLFIFYMIRSGEKKAETITSWILRLILDIFLCYLFFLQSGGLAGAAATAATA